MLSYNLNCQVMSLPVFPADFINAIHFQQNNYRGFLYSFRGAKWKSCRNLIPPSGVCSFSLRSFCICIGYCIVLLLLYIIIIIYLNLLRWSAPGPAMSVCDDGETRVDNAGQMNPLFSHYKRNILKSDRIIFLQKIKN